MKRYFNTKTFFSKMLVLCTCLFTQPDTIFSQQPPTRLYIANDDHTDYMWTANVDQYDTSFTRMLDYYIAQIDATSSNPSDLQARFNCDGSYWLKTYEKYRSPAQFLKLISKIKSGHISSPLNTLVSTYGSQPTEAVLRGMFDAGKLERRFGIRFRMAVSIENQTLPLGLSSLWAGSGAKYSWRGVCGCATRMDKNRFSNRKNQLYRYTGLDSSGVIMKWYNLGKNNTFLGGYAESRGGIKPLDTLTAIRSIIGDLDTMCLQGNTDRTYPYIVAGAFGYGWDDLETYVSPVFIKAAQTMTNDRRKVRVSNEEDFFDDIAKTYPHLPKETVSYGNEWDLYPASMNEITAKVRRSTENLRNAESIAVVASLKDKSYLRKLSKARDLAWEAFGLYWEHDWTADGPVSKKDRAEWQIRMQQQISNYSDSLLNGSIRALGSQLRKSIQPRFFVFNSLNWVRTDIADFYYTGPYPVKVIDVSTGKEVLSQLIEKSSKKYLRIQAHQVPPVGYKVFEIRQGSPSQIKAAAIVNGGYISNSYYRIRLSPCGAITEIYDSIAKSRQLVKQTGGRYLNDLGAININNGLPVSIENSGPVSVTLKAVSQDPIRHTVRLTLFANSPRIQIEDSIQANFGDVKSWSFSFDLQHPTTRHEELGAILTVKKEDNGGHYASYNGRYDWQTFNHFANVSENDYGITLSNIDCSFFKLGGSTPDSLWESSSQINALAGGQTDRINNDSLTVSDTTSLGITRQNGESDFLYQFALTGNYGPFDPVTSMKFSLEHLNPLITGAVTGGSRALNVSRFSLLSLNDTNVILWCLKPAEEGPDSGLITRFWNLNDKPVRPSLKFSRLIDKAWKTSHIETNEEKLKVVDGNLNLQFLQHQLKTYRIILK